MRTIQPWQFLTPLKAKPHQQFCLSSEATSMFQPIVQTKLEPLDVSLNKPAKDEMKKQFQVWCAEQIQEEDVPINQVKVDMPVSLMSWIMSMWETLVAKPWIAMNVFRDFSSCTRIKSLTKIYYK